MLLREHCFVVIQQRRDFFAGPADSEFQRFIDMNVTLGNALGGVAEERPDREFGEAQISGDAAERMAKRMRRDANDAHARAKPGQTGFSCGEMPVADVGRKYVRATLPKRLVGSKFRRSLADGANLGVPLSVRETHIAGIGMEPGALKTLPL